MTIQQDILDNINKTYEGCKLSIFAILIVTLLTFFFKPLFYLVIIVFLASLIYQIIMGNKLDTYLSKYIYSNHLESFKQFKNDHKVLGNTKDRNVTFIRSRYFIHECKEDGLIVRSIQKTIYMSYGYFAISAISLFIAVIYANI